MVKEKINRLAIVFFAFLAVVRLPENYSIQPSYFLYLLIPLYVFLSKNITSPGKTLYIISLFYFYFFLINLYQLLAIGAQEDKIQNVMYWPLALLLIISLSVIDVKVLKDIVKSMSFWLGVSIFFAVIQFLLEFPTRGFGLTGSPNNLALSIIHLLVIRAVLRMPKMNYLFGILGAVNLSRSYLVFLFLYLVKNYIKTLLILLVVLFVLMSQSNQLGLGFVTDFLMGRFDYFENSSDEGGRGIARLWLYPENLIFGAGDLKVDYAGDAFFGQIHNNFLAIWFCFGLVGAFFNIFFFFLLVRRVGIFLSMIYFIFSLSHFFYNNIFFVILVSCLVVVNKGGFILGLRAELSRS